MSHATFLNTNSVLPRHLEVDPDHHGNLFFWHFQNRHIGDRQRTVIWLNGGPGCSSMDGALMEIGPYRVREGGNLEYNEGSWDEFANLLFVDNPVGTGFSYVDTDSYVHELKDMATEFVTFLERWFEVFPEYEHDDVCCKLCLSQQWLLIQFKDLFSWRIIRWTTYSIHSRRDTNSKRCFVTALGCQRSSHWEWLDFWLRSISRISAICLQERSHKARLRQREDA